MDALLIIALVAIIITMIWSYERRLIQSEELIDFLIQLNLEDLNDIQACGPTKLMAKEQAAVIERALALVPNTEDDWPAATCGAVDGNGLVCSLPPHDTVWHEDRSKGNRWHSATFKTPPSTVDDGYEWPPGLEPFTQDQIDQYN